MAELRKSITENGIHYSLNGDYYVPDFAMPETDNQPLGKWGQMRLHYLQEHRPDMIWS